jgi:periodic tryptophan protein 2
MMQGYVPPTLNGHRDILKGVYFTARGEVLSVSRDGAVFLWRFDPETGKWSIEKKHYVNLPGVKISCCDFHRKSSLLVLGLSNGVFLLHSIPGFETIHQLSISRHHVSAASISPAGDWIAFGCEDSGELLVWEWKSESYILRQQGHSQLMTGVAWSSDGGLLATSGAEGKVKLWSTNSGFCFATFKEHSSSVTAITFVPAAHAVVTSSLDGTVRAFDMVRYRNFRTFTSPTPTQFHSVAVDPSGIILFLYFVLSYHSFAIIIIIIIILLLIFLLFLSLFFFFKKKVKSSLPVLSMSLKSTCGR